MATFTALTTCPDREAAEALAEALSALSPEPEGSGTFEIEDGSGRWEVAGYFDEAPDAIRLALLAAAHGGAPFAVSEVPETDWVAHVRRELHPIEAGRFFIYGAHDADKVPQGRIALRIEAAMAFGTGHHATTLGCMRALDRLAEAAPPPKRIADIGCGTAILAMAAAALWPEAEVIASDIDPQAVEVAAANAAANGLGARLRCVEAAGFGHPILQTAPFDLIFANILMAPLKALAPEMATNCCKNGHVLLAGILNEQAPEVISAYEANGFGAVRAESIGDWTILDLTRI